MAVQAAAAVWNSAAVAVERSAAWLAASQGFEDNKTEEYSDGSWSSTARAAMAVAAAAAASSKQQQVAGGRIAEGSKRGRRTLLWDRDV